MSYILRVNPINVDNQWVNSEKFYFNSPIRVEIINILDGLYSEFDWIGIFKKSEISNTMTEVPENLISIYWTYPKNFTNNTITINDLTSGVWSNVAENGEVKRSDWEQYKNGLPEGEYAICLMYNDGRKILARVDITISNSLINNSATNSNGFSSNKSIYAVGEPIVVTVNMNYTKDWVGLYTAGTSPSSSYTTSTVWSYIDSKGTELSNMTVITNDVENGIMVYSRDFITEMQYTYHVSNSYTDKSVLAIGNYNLYLFINNSYVSLDEIPVNIDTGFIWALEGLTADDEDVPPYDSTQPDKIWASGENFIHQWGGVNTSAPAIGAKKYLKLRGWIVNAFNKEGLVSGKDIDTNCYYYRVNSGDWQRATAKNLPREDLNTAGILYADVNNFYNKYPDSYWNENYRTAGFTDLTISTKGLFNEPNIIEVAVKNYKNEMIPFIVFADVRGGAYEVTYDSGTISNVKIEPKYNVRVLQEDDLPTLSEEGAEFLGWFYSYNMGRKAVPGQALSKDILLRAKWKVPVFDRFVTESELVQSDYDCDNDLSMAYIKNRPFYEYYDEDATLVKQTITSSIMEEVTLYDTLYDMNRLNLGFKAWTKVDLTDDYGETFEGHYAYCGGKYVLYVDNETYTAYVPDNELAVGIKFYTDDNSLKALLYADLNNYDSNAILYLNDSPNKSHYIRLDRFNATGFTVRVYESFSTVDEVKEYCSAETPKLLGVIKNIDLFEASDFLLGNGDTNNGNNTSKNYILKKVSYYIDESFNKYYVYKSLFNDKNYTLQVDISAVGDDGTTLDGYAVKLINTSLDYYYSGTTKYYSAYYAVFRIRCPGDTLKSVSDEKKIKYLDDKFINPTLMENFPIIVDAETLSTMSSSDLGRVISITGNSASGTTMPNGTLSICMSVGNSSLRGCDITWLHFPNCTYLGYRALHRSTLPNRASFPALLSVGTGAFKGVSNVQYINIPALTEISDDCFEYWEMGDPTSAILEVNASSLSKIGNYAFRGNSKLVRLNAPNVTYVGKYAFTNCSSFTVTKEFIENLDYIGDAPFNGCKTDGATKYSFKNGATLGTNVLSGIGASVEEIELPEVIKFNNSQTFNYCTNLKKVVCRGDFDGYKTFSQGCSNLKHFECYGNADFGYSCFTSLPYSGDDMVIILRGNSMSTAHDYMFTTRYSSLYTSTQVRVYVPQSLKSTYSSNTYWKHYLNKTNTRGLPLMVIESIEGSEYEIK